MLLVYIGIIVIVSLALFVYLNPIDDKSKNSYKYIKREKFLTEAEREFYKTLVEAVGNEFSIFAQVHLSSLIDHTTTKQSWKGALAHIDRKSVDFILCDKTDLSIRLAIELDDKTHTRYDVKERDLVKNSILNDAGVKLLRIENHGSFNADDIRSKINGALS